MTQQNQQHSRLSLHAIEFARNPQRRCPCIIIADVSDSTGGEPIAELNAGLVAYKESLGTSDLAASRVEVALVSFGDMPHIHEQQIRMGNQVETQIFVTVDQFEPPVLQTAGLTAMGAAIHCALDLLKQRKQEYKQGGVSYFRPWVVLITDGVPTDEWRSAAKRLAKEQEERGFTLFVVAVGDMCDMDILHQLSPRRDPLRLKELNFVEFFVWLSESHQVVSTSQPGERVVLPGRNEWEQQESWDEVSS
jgi:uncharacterized protein YegL